MTPIITLQPATAQTENLSQQAEQLLEQGVQLLQQYKHQEAIEKLKQALEITQKIKNRQLESTILHRKAFLKQEENTAFALVELLIQQKQPEKAFEWANLTTTFDLADYNRLINAKVANPEIQKELDNWNQKE